MAGAGPKVWISVDMEGIEGLVDRAQFMPEGREYQRSRVHMIEEMCTVVRAAWEAGASQVVVNDSHDGQINLTYEALASLPEETVLISGTGKRLAMCEGMAGADVAFFVGYHAMAGTAHAVMDHTFTGDLYRVRLNGQEVGECGLNAYLAGHYGIPVGLVTGDQALVDEARTLVAGAEMVVNKVGLGRQSARLVHPSVLGRQITEATRRAVERAREGKLPVPLRIQTPVTVEVGFMTSQGADMAMWLDGAERVDGRSVAVQCPDMERAYVAFRALVRLGTGLPLY
jgi:D-amino peptidase